MLDNDDVTVETPFFEDYSDDLTLSVSIDNDYEITISNIALYPKDTLFKIIVTGV